jgi:hypothetical protein
MAARVGFWLGYRLSALGEFGQASGWFARVERLTGARGEPCAVSGYSASRRRCAISCRMSDAAFACAAGRGTASVSSSRGGLVALGPEPAGPGAPPAGKHPRGAGAARRGDGDGRRGGNAPIVPAIVYCISHRGCRQVYALDRCREWTAALSSWCESQPQLVAFNGVCMVHRSR